MKIVLGREKLHHIGSKRYTLHNFTDIAPEFDTELVLPSSLHRDQFHYLDKKFR